MSLALLPAVGLIAAASPDSSKQELEKFRGTWRVVSMEVDGASIRPEARMLTCDGDRFTMTQGQKIWDRGTFIVKVDSTPKTIDMISIQAPSRRYLGIYEFDGDTLRFCAGDRRPKAFVTTPNSGHSLLVLKRETGRANKK
jgi:uncharacterized protein (TIGR03067 family)